MEIRGGEKGREWSLKRTGFLLEVMKMLLLVVKITEFYGYSKKQILKFVLKLKYHWYCALWKGKLCVVLIKGGGCQDILEGQWQSQVTLQPKLSSRWTAEAHADSWMCALGQKAGVFESLSSRVPDYIIVQPTVSLQEKPFIYTSLSGICSL